MFLCKWTRLLSHLPQRRSLCSDALHIRVMEHLELFSCQNAVCIDCRRGYLQSNHACRVHSPNISSIESEYYVSDFIAFVNSARNRIQKFKVLQISAAPSSIELRFRAILSMRIEASQADVYFHTCVLEWRRRRRRNRRAFQKRCTSY